MKTHFIIAGSLFIGIVTASAQTDTTNTRGTNQQSHQYRVDQGSGTTKGTGTKAGTYGTQGTQGAQATEGTQGTAVEKNRSTETSRTGSQGTGTLRSDQNVNPQLRSQQGDSTRLITREWIRHRINAGRPSRRSRLAAEIPAIR